jgi:lipopolysaccharide export system protein LptA
MDGSRINKFPVKTVAFLLIFVAINIIGISQNPPPEPGKVTKVYVENADSSGIEKDFNPDIQILRGNVLFRHDSTFMYCDSAYLYSVTNSLEAFDNVRIEQGDTLFMYGKYLHYDANISLAKMREDVRMENNDVTLFTDSFNYDRNANIAYYFEGGMMVDSLNELTSVYGQYSPDTKIAVFQKTVRLVNPQFVLTSDTLRYNTESKIAIILGPTVIESDSGIIHSTRGWYNTITGESMLYDRSVVVSKDKTKNITADSMFYNKENAFVEAYGDMVLNDTVKKIILTGNYGYYNENTDYAFATDSAQAIEYSQRDSLFLHGDTLQMQTIGEERELKAFYGVRFYRIDLQGICDSLQFNTVDSVLKLYKNPILWNTGYQINGDTIKILFNDSTVERVNVLSYAFAIEQVDTSYYNQLKGKSLTALFYAGELYRIHVDGNAESIYYPPDESNASFTGRNWTESSYMVIDVENRKPVRILWTEASDGLLLPLPNLTPENKYLKGFINYDYLRPKSKDDIFSKVEMKKEDVPPPRRTRNRRQ